MLLVPNGDGERHPRSAAAIYCRATHVVGGPAVCRAICFVGIVAVRMAQSTVDGRFVWLTLTTCSRTSKHCDWDRRWSII